MKPTEEPREARELRVLPGLLEVSVINSTLHGMKFAHPGGKMNNCVQEEAR